MDAGRDIDMSGSGTRGPPPDTIENTNTSCPRSILDDFDTLTHRFYGPAKFKAKYATYSYNVPGRPAIFSLFLSDRRGQQCRWLLSSHLQADAHVWSLTHGRIEKGRTRALVHLFNGVL